MLKNLTIIFNKIGEKQFHQATKIWNSTCCPAEELQTKLVFTSFAFPIAFPIAGCIPYAITHYYMGRISLLLEIPKILDIWTQYTCGAIIYCYFSMVEAISMHVIKYCVTLS